MTTRSSPPSRPSWLGTVEFPQSIDDYHARFHALVTPEIAAVDNGCKWRALPSDFPPFQTVYGFFARWATMDPPEREGG